MEDIGFIKMVEDLVTRVTREMLKTPFPAHLPFWVWLADRNLNATHVESLALAAIKAVHNEKAYHGAR